jgi:hypothetical protein
MRKLKSLTSILLCLALMIGMVFTVEASNTRQFTYNIDGEVINGSITSVGSTTTVITDNYIVSFDNLTGLLEIYSSSGELLSTQTVSLMSPFLSGSSDGYSYNYSLQNYNGHYYQYWQIESPDALKLTWQTTINSTALGNFEDAVNNISDLHEQLTINGYGSVITMVLAAISAAQKSVVGAIITAMLIALGFPTPMDAISNFIDLSEEREDAQKYFDDVVSVSTPV